LAIQSQQRPAAVTTEGAAGGARLAPFFPCLAHAAEVFGSCRKSLGHAHLHVLKIEFVLGERLIEPPERRNLELAAKQVELLTEAFPDRSRLAVLYDEDSADQFAVAERQARSLRLDVRSLKLENPPYDFDVAFQSLANGSPQMLLVLSSYYFTLSRSHIAKLAIQQRLPTMFIFKSYVEAG
jgi:hypothetical protein